MKLRRYRNRTLFDVERQKWVTLNEVTKAIRAGEPVTATAVPSNKDCTALVLVQVLYEEAVIGAPLPTERLVDLIRSSARKRSRAVQELEEQILSEGRRKKSS